MPVTNNFVRAAIPNDWRHSGDTMQEIINGLFLGPYSVAVSNSRNMLLENGITYIVCVRNSVEECYIRPHFEDFGVKYLVLDIDDGKFECIIRHFTKVKEFVDDAMRKKAKVLVHGREGNSRSATLVLAYVMQRLMLTYRDALQLVKERRPSINPSDSFIAQLAEYEPIYKANRFLEFGQASSCGIIRQKREFDGELQVVPCKRKFM